MNAFRFKASLMIVILLGVACPVNIAVAEPVSRADMARAQARSYPFAGYNDGMEIADLNGDGLADAAASGYFAVGLDVLINLGNGRMSRPIVSPTTILARALAFGDLDEDGHLDAVAGAVPVGGSQNLEILLGDGAGHFAHLAEINNGSSAAIYDEALAVADLNSDGHLDIVSNTFGSISVLPGNGDGTFGSALFSGAGSGSSEQVLVRDFDGDSILDVVSVAWTGSDDDALSTAYLNLGLGDGRLEFVQSFSVDANYPSGDSADLSGDSLPDLAITGSAGFHTGRGGMFVALNLGGTFGPPVHYDALPSSLALGDLNGDGLPEAALTEASFFAGALEVWVNAGDGAFRRPRPLAAPGSPYDVELADFQGSPQLDLVVLSSLSSPSELVVYANSRP